jgi:hypothetical protein
VSDIKKTFLPMFRLDRFKSPDELAERVLFLLEDDRFLCPEENYEVWLLNNTVCRADQALRTANFAFWHLCLLKPCSRNILRGPNHVEGATGPIGYLVSTAPLSASRHVFCITFLGVIEAETTGNRRTLITQIALFKVSRALPGVYSEV